MRSESKRVLPQNIAYLERPGRATKPELEDLDLPMTTDFPPFTACSATFKHFSLVRKVSWLTWT